MARRADHADPRRPRPSPRYETTDPFDDHARLSNRAYEPSSRQQNARYETHDSFNVPFQSETHKRYDPRFQRSLAPEPRRSTQRSRSPRGYRQSWPPHPFAEDEFVSLRKEAGFQRRLQDVKEAVKPPFPGSIDQEPVIIDVKTQAKEDDRSSVSSGSMSSSQKNETLTPPTSEDEKLQKTRRRLSKLNVDLANNVPDFSKRTSFPYSYTKTARLSRECSSTEKYLSPGLMTPPPSETRFRANERQAMRSSPTTPRKEHPRHSPNAQKGNDYFSSRYGTHDVAVDEEQTRSASYSNDRAKQDWPAVRATSRTAVVDFAAPAADKKTFRRPSLDARRNTDTGSMRPPPSLLHEEKPRRINTLLSSSIALSQAETDTKTYNPSSLNPSYGDGISRSRESSYSSSRAVSPLGDGKQNPPLTGSRSPRWSADFSSQGSSVTGSRPGSSASSRAASPPRAPLEFTKVPKDFDWSANMARTRQRTDHASQHPTTSSLQEPLKEVANQRNLPPIRTASRSTAMVLPYPDDFGTALSPSIMMPSERDHQYFGVPNPPTRGERPSIQPPSPTLSTVSISSRTARPSVTRGHSAANVSPTQEGRPRLHDHTIGSFANAMQERDALLKKDHREMPRCPRPDPVARHTDWFAMIGAPSLHFCPDCVHNVFDQTQFRGFIVQAPPRHSDVKKVQCGFGRPWMRLAWYFTLTQKRPDLDLLKKTMRIEESADICPGTHPSFRKWYGLRDSQGNLVKDFRVCQTDIDKMTVFMPTLERMFVPLHNRVTVSRHGCSMRSNESRFGLYIEALMLTHEQAAGCKTYADPQAFIRLVERKRSRDCQQDKMILGGDWYYMPEVPTLTVCEECYELVVEPEIRRGSSLAKKFHRVARPAYNEDIGSSCQLYSKYMRRAFRRSVEESDIGSLITTSKYRRNAELRLTGQWEDILRRARRLSQDGGRIGEDERWEEERRLERELEKVSDEWKTKYE